MKETKEIILVVVPVTVHYDNNEGRAAAIKEIVKLHFDMTSSRGFRAKIESKGWLHESKSNDWAII
jgi:hypothetical protein